jgi:hypothetical protein
MGMLISRNYTGRAMKKLTVKFQRDWGLLQEKKQVTFPITRLLFSDRKMEESLFPVYAGM